MNNVALQVCVFTARTDNSTKEARYKCLPAMFMMKTRCPKKEKKRRLIKLYDNKLFTISMFMKEKVSYRFKIINFPVIKF